MKSLFLLAGVVVVSLASSSPLRAQALSATPPPPVSSGYPIILSSTNDPAKVWREEAAAAHDAVIVDDSSNSESSYINQDVVVRGNLGRGISVLRGKLFVLGHINGPVSVINGNATIIGTVNGPVSVVNGDLRVAGKIIGPVSVVAGHLTRADGSQITGAPSVIGPFGFGSHGKKDFVGSSPFKDLAPLFLSPYWLYWKLAMLIWWLAIAFLLMALWPRGISSGMALLCAEPVRAFALGLGFWIIFWILFAISCGLLFLLVGFPLVGLLSVLYVAVKWFGLSIVFLWLGTILCRRFHWSVETPYLPLLVGVLTLGALRMIPILGFLIWCGANMLGAGICLIWLMRKRAANSETPPPLAPSGTEGIGRLTGDTES
jgi:hypothetical protein